MNEIFSGIQKAVANRNEMAPFSFDSPLAFEIRYKRLERAESASRGYKHAERLDPYTVKYLLEGIGDYF